MRADKAHYESRQFGILSEQDYLIRAISEEAENIRKAADETDGNARRLRVASQWPSRTMISCRCDTLPLPPNAADPQAQLTMLRSINYLLFNPKQPENAVLARNLAMLDGGAIETVALQPEGALIHLKNISSNYSGK